MTRATDWFPVASGLEWRYVYYDAGSPTPPRLAVELGEASLVSVRIRADGAAAPAAAGRWWVASSVEVADGEVRLVEQREPRTHRLWDPPLPILRDGLEVGASWTWTGWRRYRHYPGGLLMTSGGERGTMRFMVKVLEPVTVHAGTFPAACRILEVFETLETEEANPLEFGEPPPPPVRRTWYAKGVGVVRWETDDGEGDRWRYDLVAFMGATPGSAPTP